LPLLIFFLVLMGISYVLAFGPKSPLRGLYMFCYDYLPKFSMMRQPAKMMVVSLFALSACVGLCLSCLRRLVPAGIATAIGILLGLAVIVDSSPVPCRGAGISILPRGNEAYEDVFRENPGARVVNVPIWPGDSSWSSYYQYYATIYRTVMINGYNPVTSKDYVENIFKPLKPLNAGQIQQRQYDLLREMKIDYLVFHEEAFPPKVCLFPAEYAIRNLKASPHIELLSEVRPILVFRILEDVTPNPSDIVFEPATTAVVHEAEDADEQDREIWGCIVVDDPEASDGAALLMKEGVRGWRKINRRTTPAGTYTFSTRVRSNGPTSLTVTVFRSSDGSVLYSEPVQVDTDGRYDIASVEFSLDEAESIYYLIEKAESSELVADWFYLRFSDQADPLSAFEIEDIFHTGNLTTVEGASGGTAVYLTRTDPEEAATRGPYRLYEPGTYRLILVMGIDWRDVLEDRDTLVSCAVLDNEGNTILDEQRHRAGSLERATQPVQFLEQHYEFELRIPTFLNLSIRHFRRSIYLDRVEIERVDD
jgi:hypothetical protein